MTETTKTKAPKPLENSIITVGELLSKGELCIPTYQRPYKWTPKNITQLFEDITVYKNQSSYRLGTVVFHKEGDVLNIVDGQQRTITLLLTARALIQCLKDEEDDPQKIKRTDLKKQLNKLEDAMIDPEFESDISKYNIHTNYLVISRIVSRSDFTEDLIDFILNKCEFVTFTLTDISEAFQFFDSQNARGRDLEPHDLLKAYHLREFAISDADLKATTIHSWENCATTELANLFALYLYRIRNWAKGNTARYFGKDDIPLFKGVNMESINAYPYITQLRMAHHFVDHYNQQYERRIDGDRLNFPFHLDQMIINGRRFFEMVAHYQKKVTHSDHNALLSPDLIDIHHLDELPKQIMKTLNEYEGRNRTGDRYTRSIFDCLLLYYVDKFGSEEVSRAIEKIFIWAYSLRLKMQNVQIASMDNHVLEHNLFKIIKDAIHPSDFITCNLPNLTEIRSTKTKKIEKLFKTMKYYE